MKELVRIKIGIIFGLLFLTFVTACLPLAFLFPFLARKSEYLRRSASSSNLSKTLERFLPSCCRKRKRGGSQLTSTEFARENEDDGAGKETSQKGQGTKTEFFLDVMNCFSGGVFLGTSFLALMPEIREIFDEVGITWPKFSSSYANATDPSTEVEEPEGTLMPITEMLVTCGMFFILCLEQAVHSIMDREKHNHEKMTREESNLGEAEVVANGSLREKVNIKVTAATPINEALETEVVFNDELAVDINDATNDRRGSTKQDHEHHDDSVVRSLILVFILSMHSLLEGLAIGLQTQASSILSIFVAVLFHKSLMAFSMGNNLVQARQSARNIIIAAAVLAIASPLGISVGIVMKEKGSEMEIVNGVLQGIATGTFLFITFFEVLAKEFANHSNRVSKTFSFISGYCAILALMFAQHGS